MNFNTDIFTKFDKQWALVTAGSGESFNTMTISWGSMGTLWGRPVVTVYVRPSRYTHDFMEANDYFTVSFFPEECRQALGILGTKSGRDSDKVAEAGLTPESLENGVTFREASETLVCRKIYKQDLDPDAIPEEIFSKCYAPGVVPHTVYIGEVIEIKK